MTRSQIPAQNLWIRTIHFFKKHRFIKTKSLNFCFFSLKPHLDIPLILESPPVSEMCTCWKAAARVSTWNWGVSSSEWNPRPGQTCFWLARIQTCTPTPPPLPPSSCCCCCRVSPAFRLEPVSVVCCYREGQWHTSQSVVLFCSQHLKIKAFIISVVVELNSSVFNIFLNSKAC